MGLFGPPWDMFMTRLPGVDDWSLLTFKPPPTTICCGCCCCCSPGGRPLDDRTCIAQDAAESWSCDTQLSIHIHTHIMHWDNVLESFTHSSKWRKESIMRHNYRYAHTVHEHARREWCMCLRVLLPVQDRLSSTSSTTSTWMVHVFTCFASSTGQVKQVSKSLTIQARDCRLLHVYPWSPRLRGIIQLSRIGNVLRNIWLILESLQFGVRPNRLHHSLVHHVYK